MLDGRASWQSIAEGVIRPNSPARQEYDRRGFQPPISEVQQGRPAIAVAGHIIAKLEGAYGDSQPDFLSSTAENFRANEIPVSVIELAS